MTPNERLERAAAIARAAIQTTRAQAERALKAALANALRSTVEAVAYAWRTEEPGPYDIAAAMRSVNATVGQTAFSAGRTAAAAMREAVRRGERMAAKSTGPVRPSESTHPPRSDVMLAVERAARAALGDVQASTLTDRAGRLAVFRRSMARQLARALPRLLVVQRTLAARALNEGVTRAAVLTPGWSRVIVATFDSVTGADSVLIHGQVVEPGEPFWDEWNAQWFFMPPNRPNDREVVLPWDPTWGKPTRGPEAVVEAVREGRLARGEAQTILLQARTTAEPGSRTYRRFARAYSRIR